VISEIRGVLLDSDAILTIELAIEVLPTPPLALSMLEDAPGLLRGGGNFLDIFKIN
jgi:hypothetical protein